MPSNRNAQGLITGTVAKVESKRTVVLNRGSEHGVKLGDRFQILSRDGESIIDPETNEVIETIPYEKARVEVEELYTRAAIARTYTTHYVGGGPTVFGGSNLNELFGPRREVYDTFEAEVTQVEEVDKDLTVRVGDPIREIPSDD